jgi:uncharacterized membrane protein
MLMGYAGRYAIAYAPSDDILSYAQWSDNKPTISNEIIDDVLTALITEDPDNAIRVAQKYDADYFFIPKSSIRLLSSFMHISGKDPYEYLEADKNAWRGWKLKEKGQNILMVKMINGERIQGFEKVYEDDSCVVYRRIDIAPGR